MRFAVVVLFVLSVSQAQTFDPKMPDTVPKIAGPVTVQATLRYIDIQTGEGAAALPGQTYSVHYTGLAA
jgi:FKBP-type peptidyl-prolyl cis-trans isomerase